MLNQAASQVHIDFAPQHRQPAWPRVLLASAAAIVGSLAADAVRSASRHPAGRHASHRA